MVAQKGKDLLLKIHNGTAYVTVAGLRSKRLSFNAETVDVTDAESAGRWRELLGGAGIQRASLSGTGIFKDAASDARLREVFFAGDIVSCQIVIPDFGTVTGLFQISALVIAVFPALFGMVGQRNQIANIVPDHEILAAFLILDRLQIAERVVFIFFLVAVRINFLNQLMNVIEPAIAQMPRSIGSHKVPAQIIEPQLFKARPVTMCHRHLSCAGVIGDTALLVTAAGIDADHPVLRIEIVPGTGIYAVIGHNPVAVFVIAEAPTFAKGIVDRDQPTMRVTITQPLHA